MLLDERGRKESGDRKKVKTGVPSSCESARLNMPIVVPDVVRATKGRGNDEEESREERDKIIGRSYDLR